MLPIAAAGVSTIGCQASTRVHQSHCSFSKMRFRLVLGSPFLSVSANTRPSLPLNLCLSSFLFLHVRALLCTIPQNKAGRFFAGRIPPCCVEHSPLQALEQASRSRHHHPRFRHKHIAACGARGYIVYIPLECRVRTACMARPWCTSRPARWYSLSCSSRTGPPTAAITDGKIKQMLRNHDAPA